MAACGRFAGRGEEVGARFIGCEGGRRGRRGGIELLSTLNEESVLST
jgi:hypothetical protein